MKIHIIQAAISVLQRVPLTLSDARSSWLLQSYCLHYGMGRMKFLEVTAISTDRRKFQDFTLSCRAVQEYQSSLKPVLETEYQTQNCACVWAWEMHVAVISFASGENLNYSANAQPWHQPKWSITATGKDKFLSLWRCLIVFADCNLSRKISNQDVYAAVCLFSCLYLSLW